MRHKLHLKKDTKENIVEKKRGFTLVELLAVIVIIGVIGGIAATAIISIINNSKESATLLAINNVKSAAELYSKENSGEIEWIQQYDSNGNESGKFVCMTVRQLINNGYFDDKFFEEDIYHDRINDNTFIEIRQGTNYDNTDVIIHEDDTTQNDCEMSVINNSLSNINIDDKKSYTDRLNFDATPSEDEVGDVTFFATYEKDNIESSNIDCTNGKCLFENLEDNTGYKIKICMRPSDGNTTLKNTVCEYFGQATEVFMAPTIKIENANKWKNSKNVTISYDDTGIYDEKGIHYFKSEVNAELVSGKIYGCENFENGKNNTCNSTVAVDGIIAADTWYKVEGDKVEFKVATHLSKGNSRVITARIQDQTGNYMDSKESITRIDTKPPTCISSGGNDSWTNKDVILTGKCSDEDSGCSKKTITKTVDYSAKGAVEVGEVKDKAGNKAQCPTRDVLVDKDPPDDCSVSGGNASWINANSSTQSRIITAKCTYDGESGCDDSIKPSYEYTKEIKTTTAGAEGNNNGGEVCDKVGNCKKCPANQTVKIDRTKPNAWITASGTDNYQLYGNYDKNDLSGIASATWSGGVNSNGKSNGSGNTAKYTVVDGAGNSTPVTHETYKWCNSTKHNQTKPNDVNKVIVEVYYWGNRQACNNNNNINYNNFREYGCRCELDVYNNKSCGSENNWEYATHTNNQATIHYDNAAACTAKKNENIHHICSDGTFKGNYYFHGYYWFNNTASDANKSYVNGVPGPENPWTISPNNGSKKYSSSYSTDSICDLACGVKYGTN